jgi:hypothetical protein
MVGATEITAPQFEQNRALCGKPVPQPLQKTAIIDPSRKPDSSEDTNARPRQFHRLA